MRVQRGLREFLFVAAPKVLAGISLVAVNLLLLRYLRPELFGLYAMCLAGINLADASLGTAVDMSVMRLVPPLRDDNPADGLAVQKTALCIKAASGGALALVVAVFGPAIGRALFHDGGQAQLLYLSALGVMGLMFLRSAQAQMQIEGRFELYGVFELLHMTLKFGGIAIFLLASRISPSILLAFYAIGPGATALFWSLSHGRAVVTSALPGSSQVGELLRYAGWFLLTFSVAILVSRVDVFLVSAWASVHEAGIFSAGQTFASIPQLIGTYLSVILSPRIMPYLERGILLRFFQRFQAAMLASVVMLYLLAVFTLPRLGPWLLPERFLAARPLILLLLPGTLAGMATFPLTITIVMFLRPGFLVTLDCIALPIALLVYHRFILLHGAAGAACVTSGLCVAKAAIAQVVAWSSIRSPSGTAVAERQPAGEI